MARIPRVVVPSFPHHVTQRGNRRQKTFFGTEDYLYYIDLLSEFSKFAETEIWAYCLMPNHVHLVMVPSHEDGLRAALGEAHRRYTRHVNFRHGWWGHLWQERFHSFLMDEKYLLAAVRYVEMNPVSAGLCESPRDWRFSSARAHLEGKDDTLVRVRPMLERVADWRAYLAGSTNRDDTEQIRKHTRTGRPLGTAEFIHKIESLTGETLAPKRPGPKPKNK
jgi:putative transposase